MVEVPQDKRPFATQASTSAWVAGRPKKDPDCFKGFREEYSSFISGYELFANAFSNGGKHNKNYLSVDSWHQDSLLMGETLKVLNIGAKVLACRSNALWDILLGPEEAAKALSSSILTTKSLRLQIKYMGTRKTWITLYGVPMYTTDGHLGGLLRLWPCG